MLVDLISLSLAILIFYLVVKAVFVSIKSDNPKSLSDYQRGKSYSEKLFNFINPRIDIAKLKQKVKGASLFFIFGMMFLIYTSVINLHNSVNTFQSLKYNALKFGAKDSSYIVKLSDKVSDFYFYRLEKKPNQLLDLDKYNRYIKVYYKLYLDQKDIQNYQELGNEFLLNLSKELLIDLPKLISNKSINDIERGEIIEAIFGNLIFYLRNNQFDFESQTEINKYSAFYQELVDIEKKSQALNFYHEKDKIVAQHYAILVSFFGSKILYQRINDIKCDDKIVKLYTDSYFDESQITYRKLHQNSQATAVQKKLSKFKKSFFINSLSKENSLNRSEVKRFLRDNCKILIN